MSNPQFSAPDSAASGAPAAGGAQAGEVAAGKLQLRTIAIRVAIGSLIVAALLCAVWVMFGGQNGIITRALLTVALFAAFAGVALFDARAVDRRPQWYSLASMISWVFLLLAGAVKIWMPWHSAIGEQISWQSPTDNVATRVAELIGIAVVVRLALLHTRIFLRAAERYVTPFTRSLAAVTTALVWGLAVMLVLPLLLSHLYFYDFYWRSVVAVTILAALGSALIPLLNGIYAPRKRAQAAPPVAYDPRYAPGYGAQQAVQPYAQQYAPQDPYALTAAGQGAPAQPMQPVQPAWPTYVDGMTPLPVLPDGSPDYNAYYTGYPTYPAPTGAPVEPAPVEPAPVEPAPEPGGVLHPEQPEQAAQPEAPEGPGASVAPGAPPAPVGPPAPPAPPAAPQVPPVVPPA
ncbi:MAG: hypothetical protein GX871_02950 [Microbacteriaceae bacterium]|mgnify:CR=1 FL=1|nr:hypothetical protein [Microbacteriaceae bacterium]HOA86222.1 hypothetical protein [Microbacteriaceae bacterium]HPZ34121.1 hypothetical protein [Microbacteriaceae bacterium]